MLNTSGERLGKNAFSSVEDVLIQTRPNLLTGPPKPQPDLALSGGWRTRLFVLILRAAPPTVALTPSSPGALHPVRVLEC